MVGGFSSRAPRSSGSSKARLARRPYRQEARRTRKKNSIAPSREKPARSKGRNELYIQPPVSAIVKRKTARRSATTRGRTHRAPRSYGRRVREVARPEREQRLRRGQQWAVAGPESRL